MTKRDDLPGAHAASATSGPTDIAAELRPDAEGFFGEYGGTFVPETVMPALEELDRCFQEAMGDPAFHERLDGLLRDYVGRPTPLYRAERLAAAVGLGTVWLKREDLNHTGAHKINNCLGQALLAERMGKRRIIAETGAGQHGVATATVAALLGMECAVFMGVEDIRRQSLNVYKMRLLGAEVVPVSDGSGTLHDAVTAALRHWVERVDDTFYVLGSAVGPHPYPLIVREFQCVIGEEIIDRLGELDTCMPDAVVACVGGGSNAIGTFHPFLRDIDTDARPLLVGAEAAGLGLETDRTGASIALGSPGVLHGMFSYLLQDEAGNPLEAYSISAGLDYPGVGPEHAFLHDSGLARYESVTDAEALAAFDLLCKTEGIIPAIESAHALAVLPRLAAELGPEAIVVVTVSGRGDKDIDIVREAGLGG
jgi:tryptophan synthase beta chain